MERTHELTMARLACAVVAALDSPVRWRLTGGEVAAITQPKPPLDGLQSDAILANRRYDADALIESIQASVAVVAILSKRNRGVQHSYGRLVYQGRNVAERFFNRFKQFRQAATGYEKQVRNYLSFPNLVCAYIWIV